MNKNDFESVKIGAPVGFVCGPGESPKDNWGRVTQKVETVWGLHVVVTMPSGETRTVDSMVTRGCGIGAYLLEREPSEWKPAGMPRALETPWEKANGIIRGCRPSQSDLTP